MPLNFVASHSRGWLARASGDRTPEVEEEPSADRRMVGDTEGAGYPAASPASHRR